MNIILDIDDTINNLTEYILKKNNIDIQQEEYATLEEKYFDIMRKEYPQNENYIDCHYYLKENLFKKLAENNVIIFYTKCIKDEHIDIKHNKLEEILKTKVKKITHFNKDGKNGIYFLYETSNYNEVKKPLILNPTDYVFEDNIENLKAYINKHSEVHTPKLIHCNYYGNEKKINKIFTLNSPNALLNFLEELNKITYKEISKNKRIKKYNKRISKTGIVTSILFLTMQFQGKILNMRDVIFNILLSIVIFSLFQLADNNEN